MGWASQSGRAITNPEAPRAFAVCDNCGIWYNHYKLRYNFEWQGVQLVNRGFLVCEQCQDKPNPQLKARLMPPDPVPIKNPRPEQYLYPRNVSHLGVQPVTAPPGAVATEVDASRNFPAGTPMQIED
jgi:hypothetical protein